MYEYKYYHNKYVEMPPSEQMRKWGLPREKHATISVITHTAKDFAAIDEYFENCEWQFQTDYLKAMPTTAEQAWQNAMSNLNAHYNKRGKNVVLECLQFGGNSEFWNTFRDEDALHRYFLRCFSFAVDKIGYQGTDKNIICAVVVIEPNRRNLFVYYLPVTDKWKAKVMSNYKSKRGNKLQEYDENGNPVYKSVTDADSPRLCHTEFWKCRGGLTSYSDLQEEFYQQISKQYGTKRGVSLSLIKNTNRQQARRFIRHSGDQYDELYFDDMPFG